MKKVLVVLGVVAVGFAFTSCKKECKCNIAGVEWKIPSGTTVDTKAACDELKTTFKEFGNISCDWK